MVGLHEIFALGILNLECDKIGLFTDKLKPRISVKSKENINLAKSMFSGINVDLFPKLNIDFIKSNHMIHFEPGILFLLVFFYINCSSSEIVLYYVLLCHVYIVGSSCSDFDS